jgi:CRISPR-associated endonuclease Csn1
LGIGSYGIAFLEQTGDSKKVEDYRFPLVRSCILPGDWAELADERTRRRMWRTRLAHKAREEWLRQVFEKCGLTNAILRGRRLKKAQMKEAGPGGKEVVKSRWTQDADNPPDYRLEREFPPQEGKPTHDGAPNDAAGSQLVYSGAALRCLLLLGEEAQVQAQGKALEPWQIFKALHSAIQKRGYDPKVPWARQPIAKPVDTDGDKRKGRKSKKVAETEVAIAEPASLELSEAEQKERTEEQASLLRAQTMQGKRNHPPDKIDMPEQIEFW